MRRATQPDLPPAVQLHNFYPRSPCGERPIENTRNSAERVISIHALLAESDIRKGTTGRFNVNFYPRSPCGERRDTVSTPNRPEEFLSTLSLRRATPPVREIIQWEGIFLSTLSLRRATTMGVTVLGIQHNFYPRSPCGERHAQHFSTLHNIFISIHALLAESDAVVYDIVLMPREFLSTLSLRRATVELTTLVNKLFISIHALLAESDFRLFFIVFDLFRFLSTLSLRRATNLHPGYRAFIHYFYPRSPCGERRNNVVVVVVAVLFLSTLSLRRATKTVNVRGHGDNNFYPRSPCGERPLCFGRL